MAIFWLSSLWRYRGEILLAVQLLMALRQSAREAAQEYIKRRARQKLLRQLGILTLQIGLLALAYGLCLREPGLASRRIASVVLWGVTLYNLVDWIFFTLPELLQVRRALRGKVGYAFKYLLGVSVATELMEGNLIFLALCGFLAFGSRGALAMRFEYFAPWF